MKPTIKVRIVTDGSVKAQKVFINLSKVKVYVGVPEANTKRPKGQVGNAQLAFLHTHGVRSITARTQMGAIMINRKIDYEAAHRLYLQSKGSMQFQIPPRPIVEPAIEANTEKIIPDLRDAGKAALDGNKAGTITALKRAGLIGQNIVRSWFTDPRNHWAPNAPSTIARKGSSKPLIDTGELRKSVTYVVAEDL